MQIIKLNATESTNAFLKNLMATESLGDFTVVMAKKQLKGRGQMDAIWESESGKNLTFSVLKRMDNFPIADQFILNRCVSLAVYGALKRLKVPDLSIKWPNDILSGRFKVCGILMENMYSGKGIQECAIGIGLNVNQSNFINLPQASSLKLLLGTIFNLDEVLQIVLIEMKKVFLDLGKGNSAEIKMAYEKALFRKDKPSTFENREGQSLMGFIRGVSPDGKIRIELEGSILKEFDLKEIKLLY